MALRRANAQVCHWRPLPRKMLENGLFPQLATDYSNYILEIDGALPPLFTCQWRIIGSHLRLSVSKVTRKGIEYT